MQMDHIYGNVDLNLSTAAGKKRSPSSPDQDVSDHTGHLSRERDSTPSKSTLKFLLVALSLLLLCALVALCVLGVLYFNKEVSSESRDPCVRTVESLSVKLRNATAAAEELKSHFDRVKVNYENALRRVASLNETEKQCEVLKIKYRTVHEVFCTCIECQNCGQCGDGWRRLGVKCYYFSTEALNWMNSRNRCVERGGHLVIITSQAEQIFVNASGETHWIGLNDLETEGKWMWVNNQSLTETGVTLWYKRKDGFPDEPDNWKNQNPSGENCASLGNESGDTHSWFDSSCSKLKKYICEK